MFIFPLNPQIHTVSGADFGKGNMGVRGMEKFLQTHRCNAICQYLKLPPSSLSPVRIVCCKWFFIATAHVCTLSLPSHVRTVCLCNCGQVILSGRDAGGTIPAEQLMAATRVEVLLCVVAFLVGTDGRFLSRERCGSGLVVVVFCGCTDTWPPASPPAAL